MCDTFVARGLVSGEPVTIFGKNSDREPNEAQHLLSLPALYHPPGTQVECTYLRIPQVTRTYAALLSKPFWMWGAEMGVNEHGVAIGNEAVFTVAPRGSSPALLGMDLVRLGLERSRSAEEALCIIVSLLEAYGQGGNAGYMRDFRYDNSFLIADPHTSWLLETAGKEWVAKRISGAYAISNGLTITSEWDLASAAWKAAGDLPAGGPESGDFQSSYTDLKRSAATGCDERRGRMLTKMGAFADGHLIEGAIDLLRDHGPSQLWEVVGSPPRHKSVCMHSSGDMTSISQTTGSLVAILHPIRPICFATATAAPCTSVFKPVWVDLPVPGQESPVTGRFSKDVPFWRHELFHRRLLARGFKDSESILQDAIRLERGFIEGATRHLHANREARARFTAQSFDAANALLAEWEDRLESTPHVPALPETAYQAAWRALNRLAELPADLCR